MSSSKIGRKVSGKCSLTVKAVELLGESVSLVGWCSVMCLLLAEAFYHQLICKYV